MALAKNPPNGATKEAKKPSATAWIWTGYILRMYSKWWWWWLGLPLIQGVRWEVSSSCTIQISTMPGIIWTKARGNNSKICDGTRIKASWKIGSTSQWMVLGIMRNWFIGHVIHWYWAINFDRYQEAIMVPIHPPIKPSQVLFGLRRTNSLRINFLPQVTPLNQAKESLQTTRNIGRANQNRPLKTLCMIYLSCPTVKQRTNIVQHNWFNWNRIWSGCNVVIVSIKTPEYRRKSKPTCKWAYAKRWCKEVLDFNISTTKSP